MDSTTTRCRSSEAHGPALGVALAVAAAMACQAVAFLLVVVPLAPFAQVQISKASIGVGPHLFSFRAYGARVEVKLLPLNLSVAFVGGNPYIDEAPPEPPRLLWLDAPVGRRVIALLLAPRLAGAIVPLVVLGSARTFAAIVHGMPEVVAAFGWGRPVLERGAHVLASEGWIAVFALAICKATAFTILTLPSDLIYGIATRALESRQKTVAKIRAVVMMATLTLWVAWLVTWARWVWS